MAGRRRRRAKTIDLEAIVRDRDQLWGEAAHYEAQGEGLNVDAALWRAEREAQAERIEVDGIDLALDDLHNATIEDWNNGQGANVQVVVRVGDEDRIKCTALWQYLGIPIERQHASRHRAVKAKMLARGWQAKDDLRYGNSWRAGMGYCRKVQQ